MASAGYSILTAALMGAAAISAAHAQDGFAVRLNPDGIYAVDITTRQGSCERDYHWKISVSGGRISSAGDTPMAASGEINQRGIVDVPFRRFGQVATVIGKLRMGVGPGTWTSPTMQWPGALWSARPGLPGG